MLQESKVLVRALDVCWCGSFGHAEDPIRVDVLSGRGGRHVDSRRHLEEKSCEGGTLLHNSSDLLVSQADVGIDGQESVILSHARENTRRAHTATTANKEDLLGQNTYGCHDACYLSVGDMVVPLWVCLDCVSLEDHFCGH